MNASLVVSEIMTGVNNKNICSVSNKNILNLVACVFFHVSMFTIISLRWSLVTFSLCLFFSLSLAVQENVESGVDAPI